jgi:hypothetical protein
MIHAAHNGEAPHNQQGEESDRARERDYYLSGRKQGKNTGDEPSIQFRMGYEGDKHRDSPTDHDIEEVDQRPPCILASL